jgi:hypothetical protein
VPSGRPLYDDLLDKGSDPDPLVESAFQETEDYFEVLIKVNLQLL